MTVAATIIEFFVADAIAKNLHRNQCHTIELNYPFYHGEESARLIYKRKQKNGLTKVKFMIDGEFGGPAANNCN